MTDQPLLGRQIEPSRLRPRSHNQRACFDPLLFDLEAKWPLRKIGFDNLSGKVNCAEAFSLHLDVFDKVGTVNSFRKTGKIFDFGGERQLTACVVAFDHHRCEACARGVNCGGISGATGTNNHYIVHVG